ncbi:hypothetical protein [Ramlibacter sp. 2FC]|uniref:hypothetical protein n=1 Tax=Ramlibacter sp. 2FC TaxID=2502188 RepID=UPI0014858F65|nr:hypothetical protein [Ramlibacter sp. 2FC]
MKRTISALLFTLAASSAALAHGGHGLSGPHGHATDVWGFVFVGALAVLALWLSRGGK